MSGDKATMQRNEPPTIESGDGMLLVISGPSGVGKTTIAHHVEARLGALFSVSATTRPKTAKDEEGRDYFFIDRAAFDNRRANGQFLEWAEVHDNCYGTPVEPVVAALQAGRTIICEIDVEGAVQVKSRVPDAFSIFVMPPSEEELLNRLRGRAREDEAIIQRRFAKAKEEISRAKSCGVYDAFIINEHLDAAVDEAVGIVEAEQARRGCSRS